MSLGLMFPGQGTQHRAMLPWLDTPGPHARVLEMMAAHLGGDWRARLDDPAWAFQNSVAQLLLTGVALAAWNAVRAYVPVPRAVAGYSVGELAAFCAAGVFSTEHALALAATRSRLMEQAVAKRPSGLIAIHGLSAEQVDALCLRHGAFLAIVLHAAARVVGGGLAALASAAEEARQLGASTTHLQVPLASHTPLLASAVAPLRAALERIPFAIPHTAMVCNFHGHTERRPDALKTALAGQIAQTVQWETCMQTLKEQGVSCVLEIGPGATLSRLWQGLHPDIPARSLDDFQHPASAVAWVKHHITR